MKRKFRLLSLLICSVMFFTACGGEGTDTDTNTDEAVITDDDGNIITTEPSETEPTTPNPYEPRVVKVCFIYDNSVGGDSLIDIFEQARYEVARNQGVETGYIENVKVQQFADAVAKAKEEGYNFIVSASSHFAKACDLSAKADQDGTVYVNMGSAVSALNQATFMPSLYQPAYVTGIVAAYNTDGNKVGMVVDNNAFHAKGIANAFALGVNELPNSDIDISLKWALSDSFTDTRNSIDALVAEGHDVIFLYQTTEYGIRYCESKGIKVIGFSQKMPDIAPENYLTGYGLKVDTYLTDLVRAKQYDNFNGGTNIGTLNNGIVNMILLNENIAKNRTKDLSDSLYNLVYSERSTVFQGEIWDTTETIRIEKGAKLDSSQIFAVDWVVSSITSIQNMSGPRTDADIVLSDLEVRT